MNVLDATTLDLPRTRTYEKREVQWFGKDANGFAGVIIRLWDGHYRRRGSNAGRMGCESDFYEVHERPPPAGVMAREFHVLNITDDGQKFEYRVLVGRNHSCTCDAGRAKVPSEDGVTDGCKHRDAVRAALSEGIL